jgi:hypothetical protein
LAPVESQNEILDSNEDNSNMDNMLAMGGIMSKVRRKTDKQNTSNRELLPDI